MPALSYLVFTAIKIILAAPTSRVAGVVSKRIFLISSLEALATRATPILLTIKLPQLSQNRLCLAATGLCVARLAGLVVS